MAVRSRLRSVLLSPPKQSATAFLMAFFFFLAMASVNVIKSLQNALYLSQLGFDWHLPSLYIGLALLSGPIVFLYHHLARHHSQILITTGTIGTLTGCVLVFWFLLSRVDEWIYPVFYIWGGIFTVLLPTQGWVFSYGLYNPRQAKRMFALFGTGGILGAAFGGFYTLLGAEAFGSQFLLVQIFYTLIVLNGVLLAAYWLNRTSFQGSSAEEETASREENPASLTQLFRSRHLLYLAAVVLMTGFATRAVDLQYKWFLSERFSGSETQIIEFFGGLLGVIAIVSLLFQLIGTSKILSRFGVGIGLAILPLTFLVGSVAVLITAVFWTVVFLKTAASSIRYSVNQVSLELLYVPISRSEGLTFKSLMELVVYRLGDGLGAALILIAVLLPRPIQIASAVILLAAFGWLYFSRQLAEEYLQLLKRSLASLTSTSNTQAFEVEEVVAERTLLEALQSSNPHKIRLALQQLSHENPKRWSLSGTGETSPLAASGLHMNTPAWLKLVEPLIHHRDPKVGAAAFRLALRYKKNEYEKQLHESLRTSEVPETLYLIYLVWQKENPTDLIDPAKARQWCEKAAPEQAVILCRPLSKTQNPVYLPLFEKWADEANREVRRAAIRALGRYASTKHREKLIHHLSHKWSRRAAQKALANYGEAVVPRFVKLLKDPKEDIFIKREIPYILTRINTSSSRGALVLCLYVPDPIVSYRGLKGLNKIRDFRDLSYDGESFWPALQIWAREYYQLLNLVQALKGKGGKGSQLLTRVSEERIDWTIEKIFRCLELFLPRGDAYFSYVGYTSDEEEFRETAIELIDSRIKGELRHTLLPIFSESDRSSALKAGQELLQLPSSETDILKDALFHGDPWLKCCVIAAIQDQQKDSLLAWVERSREDVNPMVRETAIWALQSWNRSDKV